LPEKEIKTKEPKITQDTEVNLSLKIVNEMLSTSERLAITVNALNDEVKKLRKQGGQTTL